MRFKQMALAAMVAVSFFTVPVYAKIALKDASDFKLSHNEWVRAGNERPSGLMLGERLRYEVKYLGLVIGEAEAWVKEIVEFQGRKAYHVEVTVRSRSVIEMVYPVRDKHHSYIDVEHLHSLRYEKNLSEGDYKVHEEMIYDQETHEAEYHSFSNGSRKVMFIPKNVQDPISGGFLYRTLDIRENERDF